MTTIEMPIYKDKPYYHINSYDNGEIRADKKVRPITRFLLIFSDHISI